MHKILLSIIFLVLGVLANAQAPQFEWAKSIDVSGYFMKVDGEGNVYISGDFFVTTDFDPGKGTVNLTPNEVDAFILKLDAGGNFIWVRQIGGDDIESSYVIEVDAEGNVCFTGSFEHTLDLDPGPGIYNVNPVKDSVSDVFIAKLDVSGNFVWAKTIGGTLDEDAVRIKIDGSGNVYATGIFNATVDFDPGSGVYNLVADAINNRYILKLDEWGDFISAYGFRNVDCDISLDKDDNLYIYGGFFGTVDFDPGQGVAKLTAVPGGFDDPFISKFNAAGNFLWVRSVQGRGDDFIASIDIDASGNIYATGLFNDTADFDPGPGVFNFGAGHWGDAFILKWDALGNFIWAKCIEGGVSSILSLALDGRGSVYIAGGFYNDTFDPGAGTCMLSCETTHIYMLRLDESGNFVRCTTMESTGLTLAYDITAKANGSIWMMGVFRNAADFDPGPGIYRMQASGTLSETMFVVKMHQQLVGNYTIYPVPNNGLFHIVMVNPEGAANIEVYNSIGQLILTQMDIGAGTSIDLTKCANGIYIVKILNGDNTLSVQKIIKE